MRRAARSSVIEAIRLIHTALTQAGRTNPRIAVCGLNPHNGDNGAFGREEIDVIGPAVEEAKAQGLPAERIESGADASAALNQLKDRF